jgi:hypothetical protein
MQIKVTTKIGKVGYEFLIDESDDMKTLQMAAVMGNPRRKCNCCGNYDPTLFALDSNRSSSYLFVNVVCTAEGCGAKSKLGAYKEGGFFWNEFEKYEKAQG